MNETLLNVLVEKLIARDKLDKEIKEIKLALEAELPVEGYKDDLITISRKSASEKISIDLDELKKAEPNLYQDLLEDYGKLCVTKASVSYSLKKSKESK